MIDIKEIPQSILSFLQAMTGLNIDLLEIFLNDNVGIENKGDNEIIFGKGEVINWVTNHLCNITLLQMEQISIEQYSAFVEVSNYAGDKYDFKYIFMQKNNKILSIKIEN
ncbi:MAG: hypothetical protein Ta2D_05610 [Rickettsiales bacterium]|nr:MAG: hypothetical protein Ta2D_05610 [Rickettsiales bacterium]